MKGDKEVIAALNMALEDKLTAINQHFLHARMCRHKGYKTLEAKIYKRSIEVMKDASVLTDRVLFIEGLPNLQKLGRLSVGEDAREQLQCDLNMGQEAVTGLRKSIKLCFETKDHTSRRLLEDILQQDEHYIDWIEAQLEQITSMGYQQYLSQQIGD